jgi:DNA invertase Pin-like site-specific DNA recombinase
VRLRFVRRRNSISCVRSTFDLFAIVKQIVDAGGQFRSLAEPWADTATSTGRLMIAVLGGLADGSVTLSARAHRRRQEPGQGARAAYGPSPETHTAAAERSPAAASGRRNAEGACQELQCRHGDDFTTPSIMSADRK